MDLTNREIAVVFWTVAFFAGMSLYKNVRVAMLGVLKAALHIRLLLPFIMATAYAGLCVYLLYVLKIWTPDNLKTTIVWLVTFGFVTMADVAQTTTQPKKLIGLIPEAVNATAFVLYLAEFKSFPLLVEIIFVPVVTLIVIMIAVAETKSEYALVKKVLTNIQSIFGLVILVYSLYCIVSDFIHFAALDTLRDFGVPVILSVMFLPFLYLLLVYVTFERASFRLGFSVKDEKLRQYAILRGIWVFRRELEYFHRFMRDLQAFEGTGRERIDACLALTRRQQKKEKNPPVIFWDEGLSPYEAREFLEAYGLLAGDYHISFDGWCAYSATKKIGEEVFPPEFNYRIYGDERVVTRLKLEMGVYYRGGPTETDADARFAGLSAALIARAINANAGEHFLTNCLGLKSASLNVEGVRISMETEVWGVDGQVGYRKHLRIQHPQDDRGPDF